MTGPVIIPPLPAIERTSPGFRQQLDDLFLLKLPLTTARINDAVGFISDKVSAATEIAAEALGSKEAAEQSAVLAEQSAGISLGASHFVGAWSGLHGQLSVPASVAHQGAVWVLLHSIPDVEAAEPGISGVWQSLTPPPATEAEMEEGTSSAVRLMSPRGIARAIAAKAPVAGLGGAIATGSLVLLRDGAYSITTTGYGQSVTLPDARLLSTGVATIGLRNLGPFDLCVKTSQGVTLGYVYPGEVAFLSLVSTASVDGSWDAIGLERFGTSAGASGGTSLFSPDRVIELDGNRVLFVAASSQYVNAFCVDFSTGTVGSVVTISVGYSSASILRLLKLSSDCVAVFYRYATPDGYQAIGVTNIYSNSLTCGFSGTQTILGPLVASFDLIGTAKVGLDWIVAYKVNNGNSGIRRLRLTVNSMSVTGEIPIGGQVTSFAVLANRYVAIYSVNIDSHQLIVLDTSDMTIGSNVSRTAGGSSYIGVIRKLSDTSLLWLYPDTTSTTLHRGEVVSVNAKVLTLGSQSVAISADLSGQFFLDAGGISYSVAANGNAISVCGVTNGTYAFWGQLSTTGLIAPSPRSVVFEKLANGDVAVISQQNEVAPYKLVKTIVRWVPGSGLQFIGTQTSETLGALIFDPAPTSFKWRDAVIDDRVTTTGIVSCSGKLFGRVVLTANQIVQDVSVLPDFSVKSRPIDYSRERSMTSARGVGGSRYTYSVSGSDVLRRELC